MSGWHHTTLGALCRFVGGQGFPPEIQGLSEGDVPFIKVSDMELPGNARRIVCANNWLTDETVATKRFKPQQSGAVVFAKIGEAIKRERVRVLTRPTLIDNNMMAAVPRDAVDPEFLFNLFRFIPFSKDHGGTSLPYLRQSDLSKINAYVPPLQEQERIAGVLGAFDDLIETNRRIVRDIERLGKSIVTSIQGEAAEIAEATRLSEACSVIESGRRPKGGVKGIASGVPSLGAESVNGLTEFEFARTKYVPPEFAAQMKRGVLDNLDVLVYKDGGKPGEFFPDVSIVGYGYPFDDMVINEHVFRVRAAAPLGQGYLYFWLSTDRMMDMMKEIGSRTAAIPGMNSTNFAQLPIAIPSPDWRATHMNALNALVESALALLAENRDLARQRDALLPLLMSGRVRVRDVEAAVS